MTYEELATQIFGAIPQDELGAQVLAALSAASPIKVYDTPGPDTGTNILGQQAIKPFAFSAVQVAGDGPTRVLLQEGVNDGKAAYIYKTLTEDRTIKWLGPPQNSWVYEQGGSFVVVGFGDTETPQEADWGGEITVISAGENLPGKFWKNSQVTGLEPVWEEMLTRSTLIDVPTVNPAVEGELFRTSTTILNVSQG